MEYRKFGNTTLNVSEIGFGAWAIGGCAMVGKTPIGWGDVDDNTSIAAIYAALDAGINFFDTADIYGLGHSENILGKTIGNKPDTIIATKVGNVARDEQFTTDYTKAYIIEACEKSLKRLNRECIDYYQLHTAKVQHLADGNCIEAMQQLQQQGKIKYWGLSLNTFSSEPETDWLINHQLGDGLQVVLNLVNQKSLPAIKRAAANGYGIIVRMPLQFGLLTGKFDRNVSFPTNDHRKKRLTPTIIDAVETALAPIWQLCTKYEINKTQLALSYIKSYPQVSTIIPGIRTPTHVSSNTSGLVTLTAEDMLMIEEMGADSLLPILTMIEQQG